MNIDTYLSEHENKDLLRFLTCGSVDDGKSTLIGRLLFDSKLIFEDQLNALKKDSSKGSTTDNDQFDYSLLLDGLKAEREQGITIDVAYRYFSTPKRKFIIADCPGHEQYTRNMATGASTANLAIILIDARYGVVTQTKRHALIVSLLGIKHIIVAVNKMDLIDFSQQKYQSIVDQFHEFTHDLNIPDIQAIPLSALNGDNVVDKSPNMPWYHGDSLFSLLENVDITNDHNLTNFRFPVQYVNRPNLNFRGFAGSVSSGIIHLGDKIKVVSSNHSATIKNIIGPNGPQKFAFNGEAITLELDSEIDISSGDMLVHAHDNIQTTNHFQSNLIWLSETPLDPQKSYIIRHANRSSRASISNINHVLNINNHQKLTKKSLSLNEIGSVNIIATQKICIDPYTSNRETGSFIIIDPITNATAAAGMMIAPENEISRTSNSQTQFIEQLIASINSNPENIPQSITNIVNQFSDQQKIHFL
ncbi:MAG: sulfate adenylyltransferase subunit CysN [Lentisphaeria bacterium]